MKQIMFNSRLAVSRARETSLRLSSPDESRAFRFLRLSSLSSQAFGLGTDSRSRLLTGTLSPSFKPLKLLRNFIDPANKKPLSGYLFARSTGLEPATSRVTGECSNQLSYDRNGEHGLQ